MLTMACGYPKSVGLDAGLSSFVVNNVKSVGRLSFGRVLCRRVSASMKEGSQGGISVIEKDSQFRPSFDEYLKVMESVMSYRDKKRAHDANKNASKKVLLEEEGNGDGEVDQENSLNAGGDELLQQSTWKRKEKRVAEKAKVASKGETGRKEKQILGKDLKSVNVNKNASKKILVNEMGEDNSKADRENAMNSLGDELWQNSVWKRKDKLESRENRVNGGAISIAKGETGRKEKQVLSKDLKGRNAVVEPPQTPAVGGRSSGQERHADSKWANSDRYGYNKSNGKLRGNGLSVKRVADKSNTSKQGFRNKAKAWQLEGDDKSFHMERAAFRTLEESDDVVDKPRTSRMEMEERIQKLAKGLNGADIEMPEWMFSKMMRSAKIRFCDHSITRVIQILGKLGNWRRVLQVIEWLQMRERYKSHKLRYIYTAALHVLGKARRPVEALNLFQTMQSQASSYPDLVGYHSIAVTLGQAGHMRELFDVIDVMRSPPKKIKTSTLIKWDPRLEPDLVVYNAVLNACVKRKQWEGAFWVLQQLKQNGKEPSSTTYGLVMEVMFVCEKYNLVHELFRKVQKSCIPSALTYRVLINTLWKEGKIDEAVLSIQEMESRGIVGSAALYYDLARCLCSAGRCQEALMLIEKICKVANKPLVVTYTGLIQTCLDSGEIQNAGLIFKEMEKYCSPNLVTCNIMINAYIKHGMFEEAKQLFNKMLEDGKHVSCKSDCKIRVLPDTYTFNTMLDACFEGKMWEDLAFVFQKMLHHGYHFNVNRHLRIVLESSRAGKSGSLEAAWNCFVHEGRVPPPALAKERFCGKLEGRDYAAALSSLASDPGSNGHGFSKNAWLKLLKENIRRFGRDAIQGLVNEVESRPKLNSEMETLLTSCKEILGK